MATWEEMLETAKVQKRKELDDARLKEETRQANERVEQLAEERRLTRLRSEGVAQANYWRGTVESLLMDIAKATARERRMSEELVFHEFVQAEQPEKFEVVWSVYEARGGGSGYQVHLLRNTDGGWEFDVWCAVSEHCSGRLPAVATIAGNLERLLIEAYRRGPGVTRVEHSSVGLGDNPAWDP